MIQRPHRCTAGPPRRYDLGVHHPNMRVVTVYPGHIGTDIVRNGDAIDRGAGALAKLREQTARAAQKLGEPVSG